LNLYKVVLKIFRWYGDTAEVNDGENNSVKLDPKDKAKINSQHIEGEGTADQKDYFKL
jgi:hypothetical protein